MGINSSKANKEDFIQIPKVGKELARNKWVFYGTRKTSKYILLHKELLTFLENYLLVDLLPLIAEYTYPSSVNWDKFPLEKDGWSDPFLEQESSGNIILRYYGVGMSYHFDPEGIYASCKKLMEMLLYKDDMIYYAVRFEKTLNISVFSLHDSSSDTGLVHSVEFVDGMKKDKYKKEELEIFEYVSQNFSAIELDLNAKYEEKVEK